VQSVASVGPQATASYSLQNPNMWFKKSVTVRLDSREKLPTNAITIGTTLTVFLFYYFHVMVAASRIDLEG
jgi:hypothetical protein